MDIYKHLRMHPYAYGFGLSMSVRADKVVHLAQILGQKLLPGQVAATPGVTWVFAGLLFAVPFALALWLDHELHDEFPRILELQDYSPRALVVVFALIAVGLVVAILVRSSAAAALSEDTHAIILSRYTFECALLGTAALLPRSLAAAIVGRAANPKD